MEDSREGDRRRVVAALNHAGVPVRAVTDLVNSKKEFPKSVPVLIMMLPEVEDVAIREFVIRALTVKVARGLAGPPLIREFHRLPSWPGAFDALQHNKWAIGNALSVVATSAEYDDLVAMIRDRRHGPTRGQLPLALARTGDPRASEEIMASLADPDLGPDALEVLGKLRVSKAAPLIEPFLNDDRAWVRQKARKALERIGQARLSLHDRD